MSQSSLRILSVAYIGPRNNPLYVRNFTAAEGPQADLKFAYVAHSALDVIEERASQSFDQYLGLLFTLEDLAIYGYHAATKVKIIVVLALADALIKDSDMMTIFKALHTIYISYLSSPFHDLPVSSFGPSATDTSARSTTTTTTAAPAPPASLHHDVPPNSRPIQSKKFDRLVEDIAGWKRPLPPPPPA